MDELARRGIETLKRRVKIGEFWCGPGPEADEAAAIIAHIEELEKQNTRLNNILNEANRRLEPSKTDMPIGLF